ncbi:hypothetical protein HYH03_006012 [Edaphochlamys debaryana]|uniref:Uncharacterized protein n=1 Tax=Edaphochlamys debaryana TaxID=47281 RepID=A0A835Y3E5_9CHLO|nr:hypothetical protein HYH03_006012 [Edaphochlamys debaryana]|eukprot:KAG2495767.1 hypothetical protein HYH03_006012 [Edaphochlamys debaryana]
MADFSDQSLGEQLAWFDGDVDKLTGYHNGAIDEYGAPIERDEPDEAPEVEQDVEPDVKDPDVDYDNDE